MGLLIKVNCLLSQLLHTHLVLLSVFGCVGQAWCVCALWVEGDVKRENQPANKWHILAVTPSRVLVCICVSQPVPCSTLAACAGNTIDFLLAPHCDTPANSPFIFPILPVRNFKNSHTNKESCCPAGEGVTQEEVERIWVLTMACYYVLCTRVAFWLQGATVINAGCSDEAKGSDLKLYFLWQTLPQSCFVYRAPSNQMSR